MKTIRHLVRGHGRIRANYNFPDFNENSVVVITACEITTVGNNPRHRKLGDADVWVSNVAPHGPPSDPNNGVEYILHIDWPNDLNVLVDINLLDSPVIIND
jgi:hypothetical protein